MPSLSQEAHPRDILRPPWLLFIDQRHHAQHQASDRAVMLESSTGRQLWDFDSTTQEVCYQVNVLQVIVTIKFFKFYVTRNS